MIHKCKENFQKIVITTNSKSGVVGTDQGTEWKFPFIFFLSSLMASLVQGLGVGGGPGSGASL